MKAGELRNRAVIQKTTEGTAWKTDQAWTTYATVWAKIIPLRGREFVEGAKDQSELTHVFVIRYISGVKSDMRILFEGRTFKIVSVINTDERNRELRIECTEEAE